MGNFYVNYTIRSTDKSRVIESLSGRNAFVTPPKNGALVVFDEASDSQDHNAIRDLGKKLSKNLGVSVLAVLNHDDDILSYSLFEDGECTDEYDSCPGYFDPNYEVQGPSGGNAEKLCSAFGSRNLKEAELVLRNATIGEGGYTFEVKRHEDLVKTLNLPEYAVGFGFSHIELGALPPGLEDEDFAEV
jgi:hypothetical protein